MDETTNTQKGERLSFFRLFNEKGYKVQIPIIQRDYAQGRKVQNEVRANFLDAIYGYLDENIPNRDLDFIYGSLEQIGDETVFIPLDGQQRLTTLFLLHWYLYQLSDNEELKSKFRNTFIRNGKSVFTYETRSSSSEFCNGLINCNGVLNSLLSTDEGEENELSKTIEDCNWFFLSWKYDPTIQAMLNMLDAIHKKFKGKTEFFERLLDEEKPIITFLFLNLKDFSLTDDLYIKMNSRGKPLSDFENFKAKFEQSLDNVEVGDRKFEINYNGIKKIVSLQEYFAFNIDTKWADLFWNYRNLQNRDFLNRATDNNFDDEFVNFIRIIFTAQYTLENPQIEKLKDLLGKQVSDVISYYKYCELEIILDKDKEKRLLSEGNVTNEDIKRLKKIFSNCTLFLVDALDSLSNGNQKIKHRLSPDYTFYFNEDKSFESALKNNFGSNSERLRFFAYIKFLILHNGNCSGINQWMRVIHNMTHPDNMPIDDIDNYVRAAKSINAMLPHSNDILHILATNNNVGFFGSGQVLEEKIKAQLIAISSDWQSEIEKIEKHGYFNGQIGFLLEFAGIIDYYNSHDKKCVWSQEEDSVFFNKFKDYAAKASKVFAYNYENRVNDQDYVFERAVLTKGDYFIGSGSKNEYWPKNMLTTNTVKNNVKRTYSWKRLLRLPDNQEDTFKERRDFVKRLFDDERFDVNNYQGSLNRICKDKTGDLKRDYLIDCPKMMEYSQQGFIGYDGDIFTIYKESRLNHYHVEFYTYHLWCKYFANSINVEYIPLSYSGFPYIQILCGKYEIQIYFDDQKFEICVLKNNGQCTESNYPEGLRVWFIGNGYKWDSYNDNQDIEYHYYGCRFNSEEETYNAVGDLLDELK